MRTPRFFPVMLLVASEAAAVSVLHRLGTVPGLDAGTVLASGALAEDALMAATRLVALALAWWLLATTTLCAVARVCRLPGALRAVEWATLPSVRKLVERSLVVTLAVSALAAGIPAGTGPAAAAAAATAEGVANLLTPAVDRGTIVPPAARLVSPVAVPAAPPPAAPPPPPTHRRHQVAPGEHLWGLAATVVAKATGRPVQDLLPDEVAAYWVRLVEANPANLRSGDPDLLYPGEVVLLPPVAQG